MRNYDYIIVGSGLAVLYTAYRASAYGKVALLTKSNIRESNSYFAQGGIAAVTGEDDAPLRRRLESSVVKARKNNTFAVNYVMRLLFYPIKEQKQGYEHFHCLNRNRPSKQES